MSRTVVLDMCIFVIDTELSVTGIVVFIKYTKHVNNHTISVHILISYQLILLANCRVGNNVVSLFVTVPSTAKSHLNYVMLLRVMRS